MRNKSISVKKGIFPQKLYIYIFPLLGIIACIVFLFLVELPTRWKGFIFASLIIGGFSLSFHNQRKYFIAVLLISISIAADVRFGADKLPYLSLSDFPLAILLFFWIGEISFFKRKIRFHSIGTFLLIFLLFQTLSVVWSQYKELSFFEIFRTIKIYLLYLYLINHITSQKDIKFYINVLFICVIFQGLFGIGQFFQPTWFTLGETGIEGAVTFISGAENIGRVYGTLLHSGPYSVYLMLILPIALAILISKQKNVHSNRYFLMLTVLSGTVGLLLSFTRAAYVCFLISGLLILFFGYKYRDIKTIRVMSILFLVGIIIIASFTTNISKGLLSRISEKSITKAIDFRLYMNIVSLKMILNHPFRGTGINNFDKVMLPYDWTGRAQRENITVHNQYLLYAAELGIFGFFIFMILYIKIVSVAWRIAHAKIGYPSQVSIGIFAALVSLGVMFMFGLPLRVHSIFNLFWIFASLVTVMQTQLKRTKDRR